MEMLKDYSLLRVYRVRQPVCEQLRIQLCLCNQLSNSPPLRCPGPGPRQHIHKQHHGCYCILNGWLCCPNFRWISCLHWLWNLFNIVEQAWLLERCTSSGYGFRPGVRSGHRPCQRLRRFHIPAVVILLPVSKSQLRLAAQFPSLAHHIAQWFELPVLFYRHSMHVVLAKELCIWKVAWFSGNMGIFGNQVLSSCHF